MGHAASAVWDVVAQQVPGASSLLRSKNILWSSLSKSFAALRPGSLDWMAAQADSASCIPVEKSHMRRCRTSVTCPGASGKGAWSQECFSTTWFALSRRTAGFQGRDPDLQRLASRTAIRGSSTALRQNPHNGFRTQLS